MNKIEVKFLSRNEKWFSLEELKGQLFYNSTMKIEDYVVVLNWVEVSLWLYISGPYWKISYPLPKNWSYGYSFKHNDKLYHCDNSSITVVRDRLKKDLLVCKFKEKIANEDNSFEEITTNFQGDESSRIENIVKYCVEAWEFKVLSCNYDKFEKKIEVIFLWEFWSDDDKVSLQEFTNDKTEEESDLKNIKITYTKDRFEIYNWQLKITLEWNIHIK